MFVELEQVVWPFLHVLEAPDGRVGSYHPTVVLNVCNVNDFVSMILASQEDFC